MFHLKSATMVDCQSFFERQSAGTHSTLTGGHSTLIKWYSTLLGYHSTLD